MRRSQKMDAAAAVEFTATRHRREQAYGFATPRPYPNSTNPSSNPNILANAKIRLYPLTVAN